MTRTRRTYKGNSLYEIVSRAAEGLPLPPTSTTNEILRGIYGRAQRDNKVTLCNFVEMNNHNHTHVIPSAPKLFAFFYKEVKKQCTEAVKALLGLPRLRLWEARSTVAVIPRLEDAIARLVYLFCNPAKAGLVDSIDEFPGLNSWSYFKSCKPSVDATVSIPVRSYHKSAIPRLPSGNALSEQQDLALVTQLHQSDDVFEHTLQIQPLAWLKPFGITDPKQIESIRQRIIQMVYEQEAEYREARKFPVLGSTNLQRQEYFKPHVPAKRERKPFVFCSDPELRKEIIAFVRSIMDRCRRCYEQAKQGLVVSWPDGVFIPWLDQRSWSAQSP
jgi:hypothetical protein